MYLYYYILSVILSYVILTMKIYNNKLKIKKLIVIFPCNANLNLLDSLPPTFFFLSLPSISLSWRNGYQGNRHLY